jgi:site-specific DNA-methyltransferase (cytosine-N4-specific)
LLAIYLTRLIDLDFKGWRTRSADTGGAEVDAIVEGARLIFSRWQIQAKNTSIVRLDDIAKEVGLALTFIYSNVIMVVTTGDFTRDAYAYTNHVMKTSNLNIILLNGTDLSRLSADPTDIVKILNAKAERAMQVKERNDYFDSK